MKDILERELEMVIDTIGCQEYRTNEELEQLYKKRFLLTDLLETNFEIERLRSLDIWSKINKSTLGEEGV